MDNAKKKSPPTNKGDFNNNPSDISFFSLIKEDFYTHDREFLNQGLWAIVLHRLGNWRMGINNRIIRAPFSILYKFFFKLVQVVCGIQLSYTVKVGRRVKLEHFGGMILEARSIGDDVIIRQNTTFGIRSLNDLYGKPTIGNRVQIGAGAVIVGNIVVGDDCLIGANVVLSSDVPSKSIVTNQKPIVRTREGNQIFSQGG